jgi:hypothetical protein
LREAPKGDYARTMLRSAEWITTVGLLTCQEATILDCTNCVYIMGLAAGLGMSHIHGDPSGPVHMLA